MDTETLLHLSSENESLRILRRRGRLALEVHETAMAAPVSRSPWSNLGSTLARLELHPWWHMKPVELHPDLGKTLFPRVLEREPEQASVWWQTAATGFERKLRAKSPLPARESFTPSEEHQCQLLGGALIGWLEQRGPSLLRQRELTALAMPFAFPGLGQEPTIVFISDQPGLVAAQEILDPPSPGILCLGFAEYQALRNLYPDERWQYHIVYQSHLQQHPEDVDPAQYPIQKGEVYWLHEERTILGRLFGRGADHLWKWDGQQCELLQEGYGHWIS